MPLDVPADMRAAAHAAAPAPGGVQAYHETELTAGRFRIQHCDGCSRHVHYPRQLCPFCGGTALRWVSPTGGGTVYSTTTVRLDPKAPHEVCLVDLDEGVRLMSTVRNVAPGALRIGQRVQAAVLPASAEAPAMVVFDAVLPHGAATPASTAAATSTALP